MTTGEDRPARPAAQRFRYGDRLTAPGRSAERSAQSREGDRYGDGTGPPGRGGRHAKASSGARGLNGFTTAHGPGRPSGRPRVVVLAGGRSRRFGGDKLRARVDGRVGLARVVAAVGPVAREVIVAASTDARRRQLKRLLPPTVRFAVDRPGRGRNGPVGAIRQALEDCSGGSLLFVPGDMPWLKTAPVRRFLGCAARSSASVATVCWPSGETEHLFQWHRGPNAVRSIGAPARASDFLRAASRLLVVPVPVLTSESQSFRHLTRRSDLRRPAPRGGPGPWRRARTIAGQPQRWHLRAQTLRDRGRFSDAALAFRAESEWYRRAALPLLAQHALADAVGMARRRNPPREESPNPRVRAAARR